MFVIFTQMPFSAHILSLMHIVVILFEYLCMTSDENVMANYEIEGEGH